jgi:hypothetical protein
MRDSAYSKVKLTLSFLIPTTGAACSCPDTDLEEGLDLTYEERALKV